MQFDGLFLWTDGGGVAPPPADDAGHRRRGYIGGVARLIVFALIPAVLSCR